MNAAGNKWENGACRRPQRAVPLSPVVVDGRMGKEAQRRTLLEDGSGFVPRAARDINWAMAFAASGTP
jgi:hypothetical protein